MTSEEESMLTNTLSNELKLHLAKSRNVPVMQIELQMTHVKDVEINYDYLTELISSLLLSKYKQVKQKKPKKRKKNWKNLPTAEDPQFCTTH